MKWLEGKVALITGAGRGIGREEALAMAREGCNLLINDLGTTYEGFGQENVADEVVKDVKKLGVKAIANYDSVANFNKAKGMVDQAVSEFGKLDILVNNAGIMRNRMIFNMSEEEWDSVVGVHLKGTFNMTRHVSAYFRENCKANKKFSGRIINTSSDVGLLGNTGQSNYGTAKAGIAAFTLMMAAELKRYTTVNCLIPIARTRLTTKASTKFAESVKKSDDNEFDLFHPKNFTPMVIYLASDKAKRITGEILRIVGDKVWVYRGWHTVNRIDNNKKAFTPEILAMRLKSELLKGIPKKQEMLSVAGELVKM